MAEVQIKVEIQDVEGSVRKRVTLAVSPDITRSELIKGLKSQFGDILGKKKLDIFIAPQKDGPLLGKLVSEGALVIVRPKSPASIFRVVSEDKLD